MQDFNFTVNSIGFCRRAREDGLKIDNMRLGCAHQQKALRRVARRQLNNYQTAKDHSAD